jgi:DNA gyrase subunit A
LSDEFSKNNGHEDNGAKVVELSSLKPVSISDEMKTAYLDYAMSVIVSRALPDVRDGLKPVHRRVIYSMKELGNMPDKPYKKSARIVGDTMAKYHPHGDSAIYNSLVRMAQDFSLREPLVDGQGNFGSMDGDSPAQMRYTEVRLAKIATTLIDDINLNTVDFVDNYDGSESEPTVLPAKFPNLLVNGASGIAVGMATNIPTHNLGEVVDACCHYIDNPQATIEEMLEHVPAPDFPTGGIILGHGRARGALSTGRGSVIVRAKTEAEEIGGKQAIVVKEIPYQVNKAELLKKIEDLAKNKIIEGISELRDESNKLGVRMVIELKKGVHYEVVLNQLFKYTQLQVSFAYNMLALDGGRPQLMNLLDVIRAFVRFRKEVVTRRTNHLLNKAREKAHTLIGLFIAVANIDEVIRLIKASPDPQSAREALMARMWDAQDVIPLLKLVDDYRNKLDGTSCYFTEEQARAILDMKLQKLTGLEKDKIDEGLRVLAEEIQEYLSILGSQERLYNIIKDELRETKEKYATPRRTTVEINEAEVDIEDLIAKEDMVVTTTMSGYIKRVPLATYRAQRRGGRGRSAVAMRDEDFTNEIIVTNTHAPLLFFSDKGKVYKCKVYRLPQGTPQSKGRAMINLFPLDEDERIETIMAMPEDEEKWKEMNIVFVTSSGNVRRNSLADFVNINAAGKIAIRLDDADKLVGVRVCNDEDHILIATREGKALRFPLDKLRVFKSRTSDGVRGIKLAQEDDAVVSVAILKDSRIDIEKREKFLRIPLETRRDIAKCLTIEEADQHLQNLDEHELSAEEIYELAVAEEFLLAVTENGYGKRTSAYEYRTSGRGGQGIFNIDTSERNGKVVTTRAVCDHDDVILVTNGGTLIRTSVDDIRITGRNAKGVRIINTREDEKVISLTRIEFNASLEEAGDEVAEDDANKGEDNDAQDTKQVG